MSTPGTEGGAKRAVKPRTTATTARKPAIRVADITISTEERERMIREAAYYRAQQRGFQPSDPMADWLAAEAEVNALIGK